MRYSPNWLIKSSACLMGNQSMQAAIDQFRTNVERVRNLGSIVRILGSQTTTALDLSDILRAELVLAVSALDHYMHELTRLGMLDAYQGGRLRSQSFTRFQVSIASVLLGISDPSNDNWLEQEIRSRHGHRSFQNPDNIADAVRLISDVQVWNEVALYIGSSVSDIKERLNMIVNRRNQIAHEADINPSYPMMRWPIDESMIDSAVDFIEQIAEAIYDVVV